MTDPHDPTTPTDDRHGGDVTDYRLPEGMTAERLRQIAVEVCLHEMAAEVNAWADAIDPPEPKSAVTDEMVEAFAEERYGPPVGPCMTDSARDILEAVERLGWLRDPASDELTERLAMAEGLLRRATHLERFRYLTPDEAEYLRSLDGETGAERYLAERLKDQEYRDAYGDYRRSLDGEGDSDE